MTWKARERVCWYLARLITERVTSSKHFNFQLKTAALRFLFRFTFPAPGINMTKKQSRLSLVHINCCISHFYDMYLCGWINMLIRKYIFNTFDQTTHLLLNRWPSSSLSAFYKERNLVQNQLLLVNQLSGSANLLKPCLLPNLGLSTPPGILLHLLHNFVIVMAFSYQAKGGICYKIHTLILWRGYKIGRRLLSQVIHFVTRIKWTNWFVLQSRYYYYYYYYYLDPLLSTNAKRQKKKNF